MTYLIKASLWSSPSLCGWQNQLKEGLLRFSGPGFICTGHLALAISDYVLAATVHIQDWISWFKLLLPQWFHLKV